MKKCIVILLLAAMTAVCVAVPVAFAESSNGSEAVADEGWMPAVVAFCNEWISLRAEPSTKAEKLAEIPLGESVEVIPMGGEFFRCRYRGLTGYVLSEYIKLERRPTALGEGGSEQIAVPDDGLYVVPNVSEYLTLRSKGGGTIDKIRPNERLKVLGWDDLQCFVERESTGQTGYVNSAYIMDENLDYTRWPYDYETLLGDAEQLKDSDLFEVESLAETADGREVIVFRFGREDAEHHILIQCGMHAREIMTTRLGAELVRMLPVDYSEGIPNVCVHIVPIVNPDGQEIALYGPSALRDGEVADYVKRLLGGGDYKDWKANANGVDLNRNFDAGWENLKGVKPSSQRYRGPYPHSEPESGALVEYVARYPFDCTVSIHSYGSVIYWLGASGEVYERTRSFADVVSRSTGYKLATSEGGLEKGGFKDWAVEKAEIPSVTIEIGSVDSRGSMEECSAICLRFRSLIPDIVQWMMNE